MVAFQKSLDIRERLLKDHRLTASSLLYIGQTLQAAGKNQEAEQSLQRCIAMMEKVAGPDDLLFARSMVSLGTIYKASGRLRDAEAIYLKALTIREKVLGKEHVQTAEVYNYLGVVYDNLIDHQAAENYFRRAADVRERKLGVKHLDTARTMLNLGIARQMLGRSREALVPVENALKTYQELVGSEHIRTAECCHWLALIQNNLGNLRIALALAQRAFEIRNKVLGRNNLDTLSSLKNYADLLTANGMRLESEKANQQAYDGYSQVIGPESEQALNCLTESALLAMGLARYDDAHERFLRVLEIRKRVNGLDGSKTAGVMLHLATLKYHRGLLDEAMTEMERAVKTIERNEGSESRMLSDPLSTLGVIQLKRGNLDEASGLMERSIRIIEKNTGPNSVDAARKIQKLASVRVAQSRFAEAEELFRRAGYIFEKTFGPDHSTVGITYSDMTSLYAALGNKQEEERCARQAIANLEKSLGPEHPSTITALNNLAVSLGNQQRIAESEPLFRRTLELRQKIYGEKHPEVALVESNLASTLLKLGRVDEAERLFLHVLEVFESMLGKQHPEVANTLRNLAVTEKRASKFKEAEEHFRRALGIARKVLRTDDPLSSDILYELSDSLIRRQQFDEGFELLNEQQQATRRYILRVLPGLSSTEQMRFLNRDFYVKLHGSLNHARNNPDRVDLVQQAAAWWINGKAVAQESLAIHNRLARDNDGNKNFELLLKVRQELAASTMILADQSHLFNQQRRIQELVAMERAAIKKLVGSQLNGEPSNAWISPLQVKQSLPANVALIDLVRLQRHEQLDLNSTKTWGMPDYYAFITVRDENKPTRMILLGDAQEIDDLVKQIRTAVNSGAGSEGSVAKLGEEAAALEVRRIYGKLADKIWPPIAAEIGDVNQLIISPDSLLWLLPWNALPIASDHEEYLIEKYAIRFVVSPRDLIHPSSSMRNTPPVIVADPQFETREDTKAIEENRKRFAGAEQMLKNIAGYDSTSIPLVRGYHSESLLPGVQSLPNTAIEASVVQPSVEELTGVKPIVYQQEAATEQNLKKVVGPRVLSLATHGFFLANEQTASQESTSSQAPSSEAAVSGKSDSWGKMKPLSDNPLLHCGLLLNGCNNPRLPQYQDDGILTGLEIIGIDLRGTELVVLSACETGLGTVNNGDGVAGLRQAFQLAGAQSVVATLWQVPDRDSALLMNSFFDNLADGQSKANALRIAQVERIQKRRERYGAAHPYFWSAYTLTGR